MAKLVEDNRVFTAAAGNVSSADLNSLQDQLKGIVKELDCDVAGLFDVDTSAANPWAQVYSGAADNREWAWYTTAPAAGQIMTAVLPIRAGCKITDVDVIYKDASQGGGAIELRRQQHMAVGSAAAMNASTQVSSLPGGNPWNQGGANWIRDRTAVNHVVVAGYQYFIKVTASAGANPNYFKTVVVYYQMGN